jgi:hypothetical protein
MEKKISMFGRSPILLVFILILLPACTPLGLPLPTAVVPAPPPSLEVFPSLTPVNPGENTPTGIATLSSAPVPTTTPLSFPGYIPPLYTLNASLDYAAHTVSVDESIFYQNGSGLALSSIVMAVESNNWTGCFKLGYLTINGQEVKGLTIIGDRLDIPLETPLPPEGTLNVSLHFDLNLPPADSYHLFGFNTLQVNLVDWYPFIVPYSEGWILHPPAKVGEHLVYDVADFDVTLSLIGQIKSVVVAASSPLDASSGTFHYRLQNARTFVLSASPSFQTISVITGGVTITSYFFGTDDTSASAALDAVVKALKTFGELFGPYPLPGLSIVESPFFDGMEYSGLFFLSRDYYFAYDGTMLNNLVDIAVHETAHQWWFGLVGSDQALSPWLDEALATYSENLFYEQNFPKISTWWLFRVEAFGPSGWVDTDIYNGVNFRVYANAVYLRGAQFLQTVRMRIGNDAFFAFLKDYAAQMSYRRSSPQDFFRILATYSRSDLSDIISSFFNHQY